MKKTSLPAEYNDLLVDIGNTLETIKGQFNQNLFNQETGRLLPNSNKAEQKKCKKVVRTLKKIKRSLDKISSKFVEEIKEE